MDHTLPSGNTWTWVELEWRVNGGEASLAGLVRWRSRIEQKRKGKETKERKGKERKGRGGEREEDQLLFLHFPTYPRTKEYALFTLQEVGVFSFLGYSCLRAIKWH